MFSAVFYSSWDLVGVAEFYDYAHSNVSPYYANRNRMVKPSDVFFRWDERSSYGRDAVCISLRVYWVEANWVRTGYSL